MQPARSGLGTKLMRRVLTQEIGGDVEVAYLPEGVVFTAVAALADAPADQDLHSTGLQRTRDSRNVFERAKYEAALMKATPRYSPMD